MLIHHTPHHLHFEIDFDTFRLLQYALIALGLALLLMLLAAQPTKQIDNLDSATQAAPAAQSFLPHSPATPTNSAPPFSAKIDAGMMVREQDQPYFIPSPD
jgi:hypothetical protein